MKAIISTFLIIFFVLSAFLSSFSVIFPKAYFQEKISLSEIMFNPSGNENLNEFVEIYNTGIIAVDLQNWQISDSAGTDFIIDAGSGTVIQPGNYAVILDPDYFGNSSEYDSIIPSGAIILTIDNSTFGSRGFNNSSGERVTLKNPDGFVVSEYIYTTNNADGFSEEKIFVDGMDIISNWGNSKVSGGTPGNRNSIAGYYSNLTVSGELIIPFPLYVEKVINVNAYIKNTGKSDFTGFTVRLYIDVNDNGRYKDDISVSEKEYDTVIEAGDSLLTELAWIPGRSGYFTLFFVMSALDDENPYDNDISENVFISLPVNSLVISEIMFRPAAGHPEWVEIYNNYRFSVNLQAWKLGEYANQAGNTVSENGIIIEPDSYCLVTEELLNPFLYNQDGFKQVKMEKFPSLNNTGDCVLLIDPAGQILDSVSYLDSWSTAAGISIERRMLNGNSDSKDNWGASASIYGATPGSKNSIDYSNISADVSLKAEPNPYAASLDGGKDEVIISYSLPFVAKNIKLFIYDRYGRKIKEFLSGGTGSPSGHFRWDLKGSSGNIIPTGLYILFLEAILPQAGKKITKKETLVIAGR